MMRISEGKRYTIRTKATRAPGENSIERQRELVLRAKELEREMALCKAFLHAAGKDASAAVKYAAIEANKEQYLVAFMCQFFGVLRSGCYAWRKRKGKPDCDDSMRVLIAQCRKETKETYGYRRVQW